MDGASIHGQSEAPGPPGSGEEWGGFFSNDATPMVRRWEVTKAVIEYVLANATKITPVWQRSRISLERSS
ncbi:MAG: hypothetical protein OXQ94_04965 [Gemmatimonadota bacterium]|nr:hypothetical protein [Gemmatimonadota bacterium]MDE2871025.1 hypothetical protein [Gemmatimonadota bacterium]